MVRRRTVILMLVVGLSLMATPMTSVQAQPQQQELGTECDRFIEAYVRSSARKMHRALSQGEYELEPVDLADVFEVSAEVVEDDEGVEFEVFEEIGGEVVGVVDRRREWNKTYVVANGNIGPIVASQTWQDRHLRAAGQACEPIISTVEWPAQIASTVDIEPFQFWGLRIVWRVPTVETVGTSERSVDEVLTELIGADAAAEE